MWTAKQQAAFRLKLDLQKSLLKLRVDLTKSEEKAKSKDKRNVIINGDEYRTENEILDAYGYGFITQKQMETAVKKINESKVEYLLKVLQEEKQLLDSLKESIDIALSDIIEEERIKNGNEDNN